MSLWKGYKHINGCHHRSRETQHSTTTYLMSIPSSMVNMMSNEKDQYFQCQEPGHIALHSPHIRCHECDEFGHIVMDCPHRKPHSGSLAPHHKAHRYHHNRSSSRNHQEDWERRDWSRSHPRHSKNHSSSHHDLHRSCSWWQQWDRHSHHRSSSKWSHSVHQGHNHRSCHDTPHQSHHKYSTYHRSSGYHSQDHSRSHSWPPSQLSKYSSYQKGSCSLGSYSSPRSQKPHPRKNMKV